MKGTTISKNGRCVNLIKSKQRELFKEKLENAIGFMKLFIQLCLLMLVITLFVFFINHVFGFDGLILSLFLFLAYFIYVQDIKPVLVYNKEEKELKNFYSNLPLESKDIRKNDLKSWRDYFLYLNRLSNDIFTHKNKVVIHNEVKYDISYILSAEYTLPSEKVKILHEHLEEFIFYCDTEEKLVKLMDVYLNINRCK